MNKIFTGEYSLTHQPEGTVAAKDSKWETFWDRQNNYLAQSELGQWLDIKPVKLWKPIEETTENNINGLDAQQYAEELQKRQWEREDIIRKETQEREDNAWQRAVADMRAAGINPNIVNASAAASGGGITNATSVDNSLTGKEMEIAWKELETYISNEFNADENQKDRLNDIINNIAKIYAMYRMIR